MIRKILVLFIALELVLLVPLYFVQAGYTDAGINLKTRLEVSSDNVNWVNYLAEDKSGSETLTVAPGSTIYFRLKTWNSDADNTGFVNLNSTFTNPAYLTNTVFFATGGAEDLDGDSTPYLPGPLGYVAETGSGDATLLGVGGNSTADTNFQSGGMTFQISSSTPEQTVILATTQITSASPLFVWIDRVINRAYADSNGTSQARVLVATSTPAATLTPTTPAVSILPATGYDSSK